MLFFFVFALVGARHYPLQPNLVEIDSSSLLPDIWVTPWTSSRALATSLNGYLFKISLGSVFFKARGNNWESLGMPRSNISARALTTGMTNYLHSFALGSDKTLWYNSQNSVQNSIAWRGWRSLGGDLTGIVCVASNHKLHVFGLTTKKQIVRISEDPKSSSGWGPWEALGGNFLDLQASVNDVGRIELFAIEDLTFELVRRSQLKGGTWSSWERLGGVVKSLFPVKSPEGKLHVFAIDQQDTLVHCSQENGEKWSPVRSLASDVVAFNVKVSKDIEVVILNKGKYLYKLRRAPPPKYWEDWSYLADLGSLAIIPAV